MSGHTFTLSIELGNAAMQTPQELADAIEAVAERVRDGQIDGKSRDENGNTVGAWELPYGYPPEQCDECGGLEGEPHVGEPCPTCGGGYDD